MPVNIYFTGAVGVSWTSVREQDSDGDTVSNASDMGLGLNLDIGKEWWVSDNWGLGVAARLWYTALTHKQDLGISSGGGDTISTDFKLGALAVLFSATYQ
jgi:outer membrane protein W